MFSRNSATEYGPRSAGVAGVAGIVTNNETHKIAHARQNVLLTPNTSLPFISSVPQQLRVVLSRAGYKMRGLGTTARELLQRKR